MSSWRINVSETAAPFTALDTTDTNGGMVIRAQKGNAEPVRIEKGNQAEILRLFGYPSAVYPDVQEALDYITDSPMYISAPNDITQGKIGGVLVKTTGSIALPEGLTQLEIDNLAFDNLTFADEIGTGDGATTNFVFALTGTYVNTSLSEIRVGSTVIDVSVTDAEPEVITGTGITSGTLTRGTGTIDVTFDTAPALNDVITAVYKSDESADTYFAILSNSPNGLNDESVMVSYNTDLDQFEWDFYIKNQRGADILVASYTGSNLEDALTVTNQNNFMEVTLDDVPYFQVKTTQLAYSAFADDSSLVGFTGGERASTFTSADYTEGWAYFQEADNYPTRIFMDVTGDDSIPAIFDNLRKNFQKYSRYLCILPDNETSTESIATKAGYSIDNRGLYFFSNWGLRKEVYKGTKLWSSLIGQTAIKYAEIAREAFGGLAPSWVNENGLGGQLSVSVEKMRYSYSEAELKSLDQSGINPRIFDRTYGIMITSQKTGQSPAVLTDFTFASASGLADYIIEEIIAQALVQQITKLNDANHRTQVKTKADAICTPPQGAGVLTAFFNKCDGENNGPDVLNARQFVLDTVVQFTPTSELIQFNFISVEQGVDVETVVGV